MPGYVALQLANTAALVVLSAPFAALLASGMLGLRAPVVVALVISLLGLVLPSLPGAALALRPGPAGGSAAIDFIKFAAVLPLITLVAARWLPSNNSSKPTPLRGAA
jgi:hypothetical protein